MVVFPVRIERPLDVPVQRSHHADGRRTSSGRPDMWLHPAEVSAPAKGNGSKFAPTQDVGDQLDRAVRPMFPRKACTGAWVIVSASFRHQCFLVVDSFPAK